MIAGNTFLMNRHAIAADGDTREAYTAWFNLVLSNVPTYKTHSHEQDFDMHGTGETGGYGENAGSELDIGWNTFLGGNRNNFQLRGEPLCDGLFSRQRLGANLRRRGGQFDDRPEQYHWHSSAKNRKYGCRGCCSVLYSPATMSNT